MAFAQNHSLRARLLRGTDRLADLAENISAILLALIIIVNLAAVLARYVFSSPIGWSEEAMRYGIVWAVYIVAGTTFRRGEQMAIDLIDILPSPLLRRIAAIVSLVATLTLAAVVVVLGLPFLLDTGQVSPSMRLPMWIPYASVVIGYLFIAVQAIAAYVDPPATLLEELSE
ncbi:MAG: TRAP transporter small permease [Qingshengfaniella sp.]